MLRSVVRQIPSLAIAVTFLAGCAGQAQLGPAAAIPQAGVRGNRAKPCAEALICPLTSAHVGVCGTLPS